MFRALVGAALLVVCTFSHAGSWITYDKTAKIIKLSIEGTAVGVVYSSVDDVQSSDGCSIKQPNGERYVVLDLKNDTKNGDRQYAALLAAFASGKSVLLWSDGCIAGPGSPPKIFGVHLVN